MILLPAHAEPAANAGTGPEGHRRSASVESGASLDATMVACDIDWIDGADMGAVDGRHKSVAIDKALTSPPERAACIEDPAVHDAQRGRVSTDTASGAPALATTTTNAAGSSTAAAPITVSISTATAFAVADPNVNALNEPSEAPDGGHDEGAPARSAAAAAARAAAGAAASSAGSEVVMAPSTPAAESSAIANHSGPAHASASATARATGATGAAASESDTIVANETSRGDAGCPETPVVSRRSHVVPGAVPMRAFCIGRTSSPAPATRAPSGSKSAVIVANATLRGGAHCPPTPVVSRVPVPRSHAIAGAVVNGGQYGTFAIGRRSCTPSAAASAPATALAAPPAHAPPAVQPMPATAVGHFGRAGSCVPPQNSPARGGALRAISRVVRRGMAAIRNALTALYTDGIGPTNGNRSTSTGRPEEDGCGDGDAPIDTALLGLRKRQRRRFL